MGQKISEMTDVAAGASATDEMELSRSSSSSSFRISLTNQATFIKSIAAPLVGTTLVLTAGFTGGVASNIAINTNKFTVNATTGNTAVAGTLIVGLGLTVTSGGATITAGGVTITAGGLTITAGGLTVTAGTTAVQLLTAADNITQANNKYLRGTNTTSAAVQLLGLDGSNVIQIGPQDDPVRMSRSLQVGVAPTGGDKGVGTINCAAGIFATGATISGLGGGGGAFSVGASDSGGAGFRLVRVPN